MESQDSVIDGRRILQSQVIGDTKKMIAAAVSGNSHKKRNIGSILVATNKDLLWLSKVLVLSGYKSLHCSLKWFVTHLASKHQSPSQEH